MTETKEKITNLSEELQKQWQRVENAVQEINDFSPSAHPDWTAQECSNFVGNMKLFARLASYKVDELLEKMTLRRWAELARQLKELNEKKAALQCELATSFFNKTNDILYDKNRFTKLGEHVREALSDRR